MSELGQSFSRQAIWDRNPNTLNPGNQYNAQAVAPHGATTRWTYTVPSNFRTMVSSIFAQFMRITAAAPVGRLSAGVQYTASGGAGEFMLRGVCLTNVIGDKDSQSWHGDMVMLAGDNLLGTTSDAGTGGTVDYTVSWQGVEFNV